MDTTTVSWTMYSPLDDDTSVLDPLGFDYFAQLLGNIILPSFTSRTGRARYYSMVAYGIYICREYLRSTGSITREKDLLDAFKLYEKYWARAVVEYYGNTTGLAERDGKERELRGKRGAIKAYNEGIKTLDFNLLSHQLELGALGAYRSSMEALELLKPDLSLTHKGLELAQSFVDTKRYDKMVIHAIRDRKIIFQEGNQTLNSLGEHTCLDASYRDVASWLYTEKHYKENELLKSLILDNPQNVVAITFIYNHKDVEVPLKNPMKLVDAIASSTPITEIGANVINVFKTIQAFEYLAIAINNIWCSVIRNAQNNMGRLTIQEAVHGAKAYLDELVIEKYIPNMLMQTAYRNIKDSLHGISFSIFLQDFQNIEEKDYESFIIGLVKYHSSVMHRRNSGLWMLLDGTDIIVRSGYDYPRKTENATFLHGYKITNIINMIEDTEWEPNVKGY